MIVWKGFCTVPRGNPFLRYANPALPSPAAQIVPSLTGLGVMACLALRLLLSCSDSTVLI
jgi:hypothetical protein